VQATHARVAADFETCAETWCYLKKGVPFDVIDRANDRDDGRKQVGGSVNSPAESG